jgi:hypothetical protein
VNTRVRTGRVPDRSVWTPVLVQNGRVRTGRVPGRPRRPPFPMQNSRTGIGRITDRAGRPPYFVQIASVRRVEFQIGSEGDLSQATHEGGKQ